MAHKDGMPVRIVRYESMLSYIPFQSPGKTMSDPSLRTVWRLSIRMVPCLAACEENEVIHGFWSNDGRVIAELWKQIQ